MQEQTSSRLSSRHPGTEARPAPHVRIITMLVLSVALTWVAGYWIRQGEIIVLASQMTEAVPSIPGLTALLLLIALNPLLRRLPYVRALSSAEIIVVYIFTTVATFMFGCGVTRFLIAIINAPYYYTSAAGPLEEITHFIPGWLSPPEAIIHKWLYEASPTGGVPWGAWTVPILAWAGFFVLFGGTLLCLMVLFSEQWIERERLVFPLVRLPLQIIGEEGALPLFRNPITWLGIGLATGLNVFLMIRGVFLGGPNGTLFYDLAGGFTGYPWQAMKPFSLNVRPGLIGLGYLLSTELSFSIWFFYLFQKLQALIMAGAGLRLSGMPFGQEQGLGAYLVMGGILVWKGRHAIRQAWRSLVDPATGRSDALPYGLALAGSIVGIGGLLYFFIVAGMAPWLAAVYLLIVLTVGLVYGRLRAETGVPLVWAFPYHGHLHKVIGYFLGQEPIISSSRDLRSPTIFATMIFLSRGYSLAISGYEIEALNLGQRTGITWRQIVSTLMIAVAAGTIFSFVFHLQSYYRVGAVAMPFGIWGGGNAIFEYGQVLQGAKMPFPPDVPRMIAVLGGGLLVGLTALARSHWFGFPFHPIGYVLASSYGDKLWGPFLIVWACKSLFMRYGGSSLYLRALPGFLGFAVGHFITSGLIWGSLGAALGGPFLRWGVWFG